MFSNKSCGLKMVRCLLPSVVLDTHACFWYLSLPMYRLLIDDWRKHKYLLDSFCLSGNFYPSIKTCQIKNKDTTRAGRGKAPEAREARHERPGWERIPIILSGQKKWTNLSFKKSRTFSCTERLDDKQAQGIQISDTYKQTKRLIFNRAAKFPKTTLWKDSPDKHPTQRSC